MSFNYLAFSSFLLGALSFAVCGAEIHSEKVKSFQLKPQVCIVKKVGDSCELVTKVQWQITEVMEVCLVKQGQTLQCWKDKKKIEQTLAIILNATAEVALVDGQNIKLASEVLEVNAINPKQRRKRLRPAWSLF